jgi:hypothetical protein
MPVLRGLIMMLAVTAAKWLTQVGRTGQTVRVHGREFAVDAIYG